LKTKAKGHSSAGLKIQRFSGQAKIKAGTDLLAIAPSFEDYKVLEKKLLGKKSGKGFYIHGKVREVNRKYHARGVFTASPGWIKPNLQ
jgi:hypothetical protein